MTPVRSENDIPATLHRADYPFVLDSGQEISRENIMASAKARSLISQKHDRGKVRDFEKVFKDKMAGKSYREIGEDVGLSKERIRCLMVQVVRGAMRTGSPVVVLRDGTHIREATT